MEQTGSLDRPEHSYGPWKFLKRATKKNNKQQILLKIGK